MRESMAWDALYSPRMSPGVRRAAAKAAYQACHATSWPPSLLCVVCAGCQKGTPLQAVSKVALKMRDDDCVALPQEAVLGGGIRRIPHQLVCPNVTVAVHAPDVFHVRPVRMPLPGRETHTADAAHVIGLPIA